MRYRFRWENVIPPWMCHAKLISNNSFNIVMGTNAFYDFLHRFSWRIILNFSVSTIYDSHRTQSHVTFLGGFCFYRKVDDNLGEPVFFQFQRSSSQVKKIVTDPKSCVTLVGNERFLKWSFFTRRSWKHCPSLCNYDIF